MKRYKIWPLVLAVLFAAAVFLTPRVFADDACTIAGESDPLICGTPESDEEVALMETVKSVLNTVYLWIGILSVIFIVVGGIHYMTSTGEAEKIKHAKATITYSIIGLVVTLAAFAITNFVVGALQGNAPGDKVASSPDDTFGENRKKVKAITAISKTTLTTGQTITLKARIIPDYAQNKDLSYASSNSEVATVDEDGEVEAKKPGNTTITIASADGPKTNVNITVKEPIQVNGIQLSETRVSLEKGKSVTIKATVLPKNAADQTVTWTSSNPKVATVSQSGTIKGIIDGKTTVTVKSKNGKTAKVAVTVSSDIVQTQESTENKKFSGHLDFRPETRKIVDKHLKDFYWDTYKDYIKHQGGYTKYVKNLKGIFKTYAGKKIPIKTAADLQAAAEYVWGLWTIWGVDYRVGDLAYAGEYFDWGGGSKDGFYRGLPNRHSIVSYTDGSINSILKPSTNVRTNCNFAINTFIKSTNLKRIGGSSWGTQGPKSGKYKKIHYIDELQVGDLIYFRLAGNTGYHHVAIVGEVYKDYVVIYDGGSRFTHSKKYKKKMKRKHSNLATDDYKTDHDMLGLRIWNIDQTKTLEGLK